MPIQDLLTTLTNQDRRRDKKVILNAIIKHLETDSSRTKFTLEDRDTAIFFASISSRNRT